MQPLAFELQPGYYRLLHAVLLAIVWFVLAIQVLPLVIACAGGLLILLLIWIRRPKRALRALAQLDQTEWTLQWQSGRTSQLQCQRVELLGVSGLGIWCFVRYLDLENGQIVNHCILRDQLNQRQWRLLCQMRNFY